MAGWLAGGIASFLCLSAVFPAVTDPLCCWGLRRRLAVPFPGASGATKVACGSNPIGVTGGERSSSEAWRIPGPPQTWPHSTLPQPLHFGAFIPYRYITRKCYQKSHNKFSANPRAPTLTTKNYISGAPGFRLPRGPPHPRNRIRHRFCFSGPYILCLAALRAARLPRKPRFASSHNQFAISL